MCTRYLVELSPELRPIIEAARDTSLARRMVHDLARPVITQGEVRPTDIAPVIAVNSKGKRSVFPMIWGFMQPDRAYTKRSAPLVNARSETAHSKPTFRECFRRRRCVIPACCYYEWEHLAGEGGKKKAGDKYAIQPAGSTITLLAGLYRIEGPFPHFTVLTRTPSPSLARLHDRMPLILPASAIDAWIDPYTAAETVEAIMDASLTDMVMEKV